MQPGGFSRPVVVRESFARHCFLSLPRLLASLVLPAQTPTFSLVDSGGRKFLASWAGEVHSQTATEGEEYVVYLGREVLRRNALNDGDSCVLTQVSVPPPCSSARVVVASLGQWEDLALNAEVAQSAFLSQVRVLGLGQRIPLWLEGGACVTLTVTGLDPPHTRLTLHPMSQIEVLPPQDNEDTPCHTAINFTASDLPNEPLGEQMEHQLEEKADGASESALGGDLLTLILEYIASKLKDHQVVHCNLPIRKNIRVGVRVVDMPMPVEESEGLWESLMHHPSLVIVSRNILSNAVYREEVSFLAIVRVIRSPQEHAEKLNSGKEEKKSSDNAGQDEAVGNFTCTVVVWENYIRERNICRTFTDKMSATLKGNNCVIPDVLRRLMKFDTFSVIELQTSDITTKSTPVCVDLLPIAEIDESQVEALSEKVKMKLIDMTDQCPVVINKMTLMEVNIGKAKPIDVLIRVREGVPLQLTRQSAVLLKISLLKEHFNIPHILNSTCDLKPSFQPRYPYVGDENALSRLQEHVLLSLGGWTTMGPQFALLQGSKGSGKTSLLESLMISLSKYPHYTHCEMVAFKQLRGKKVETVEKKLQLVFKEAIFRRPAVICLDDIDRLVPSAEAQDQDSGPLYNHTVQMVTMIKGLLNQVMQFLGEGASPMHEGENIHGGVVVIASCVGRCSVHPLLVKPQGCHYFPCTFTIPPLNPENRLRAFNAMLIRHLSGYNEYEEQSEADMRDRIIQGAEKLSQPKDKTKHLQFDAKMITRQMESCLLPDLNHLALRTFLQAFNRWKLTADQDSDQGSRGTRLDHVRNASLRPASLECGHEGWEDAQPALSQVVLDCDVAAALEGYTPLALRGLSLSEKRSAGSEGVGGLWEARRVLEETLTWPASYPVLFSKIQLRLRSGVLLYGPPGSGKTLLAHSMTASCHLNFITVKGPELLSKYIGASEEAVRDAFERASSAKPCVLFFDEFESIAPRRGHDSTGVTDRVVNQLLTQMDGVEGLSGVFVLAATSRPDLIDPALLRPGRLDKCVFCPMPTLSDREEILEVLSRDMSLGEEIDWGEVAAVTENFTGADLQSLLSSAQVLVAQEALGDSLYEGVIPSMHPTEPDASGETNAVEGSESLESDSTDNEKELAAADSYGSLQEVVFTEKGEVVVYREREVPLSEEDATKDSAIAENLAANTLGDLCSQQERLEFKVYRRHIEEALREVKPSVTQADRQRYERLYNSFTKSREGSFGQPSPGKRATLA